jgi:16S rRNA (guanine527-N7)-methyltransferase
MSLRLFFDWAQEKGLSLDLDQRESFETFKSALYAANQVANFTRVPEEECWLRHFVDSLLFFRAFGEGARVLDLGSGPGFPAWPLACARPDLRVTALDSNAKMLGFLRSQPLRILEIVQSRAEDWRSAEKFDYVTGRAVAPLPIQLEISAPLCKVGGLVLPMRTPSDDLQGADLDALGLRLVEVSSAHLPGTDIDRVLPAYRKERPTPPKFPRRWAEIKASPLTLDRSARNPRSK